jgi:diguanylate cyclase (GGDEF)-like protein
LTENCPHFPPVMSRESISSYTKGIVILSGGVCFALSLANLPAHAVSWGFLIVLALAAIVAPKLTLRIPRSRLFVSFSDALIFLSFLIYGGEAAIVLAATEMLANCYYNKYKGNINFGRYMIATNTSTASVSTAITYLIWALFLQTKNTEFSYSDTKTLIPALGILALTQFFSASVFTALFQYFKDGSNVWHTWKKNCFSSSVAHIVGAGLAGMVYQLISFGDIVTGTIAFLALSIVYLSYRQSISEVNAAINQAETAEREKAETERQRRREAEKHASELTVSLQKEEEANESLRQSEKSLQHAALYDSLTNLANRKHLGDILRRLIEEYKEDPSVNFHVLFLDIRKFKNINDSLGHTLGDKVLTIAAKRFVRMLNANDLVARIGGDEFAIILKNVTTAEKAQKVARRIYDSIAQPFSLSGNQISISVNIGIAPCDAEYNTPEDVLRDADIAMHYAKEKNSGVAVFTKELRVRFLERVRLENDLRNAIDRKEFAMHYQPLIDLQDGGLFGFEALLRWNHSELGNIPPDKFIHIAEESGLIIPITVWILQETTNQLAKWQKIGAAYGDLIMSVNISGKHLSNDDLIDDVENALAASKISPSSLKLEITESAAMENAELTISILNRLKRLGVQLSIDDFGTGYSSLNYLHRLPFDTLKIDRSFVYSVGESGENSEILQTIISLAKSLKKKVIAEGIETESQLRLLQNLGCDYGQGYLMSKPMTKENAEKALYEGRNWLPTGITDSKGKVHQPSAEDASLPVF